MRWVRPREHTAGLQGQEGQQGGPASSLLRAACPLIRGWGLGLVLELLGGSAAVGGPGAGRGPEGIAPTPGVRVQGMATHWMTETDRAHSQGQRSPSRPQGDHSQGSQAPDLLLASPGVTNGDLSSVVLFLQS